MLARYWRAVGLTPAGAQGAISAAWLVDEAGTRVDIGASLTCTAEPETGSLAALADGDAASFAAWPATALREPGFSLQFDLGSAKDVYGLVLGAVDEARWIGSVDLEYLSGGLWVRHSSASGLKFPGAGALTDPTVDPPPMMIVDGAPGSPANEIQGRSVSLLSGAGYSSTRPFDGTNPLWVNGLGGGRILVGADDLGPGNSAFTFDVWVYIEGPSVPDADGSKGAAVASTWAGAVDGWIFGISGNATGTGVGLQLDTWGGGNARFARTASAVPQHQWVHLEASHDGAGVRRIFMDGASQSVSYSAIGTPYEAFSSKDGWLRLGGTDVPSYPLRLNGFLAFPRFRWGVAHTANFTPVRPRIALRGARGALRTQAALLAHSSAVGSFHTDAHAALNARDMEFGGRASIVGDVGIKGAGGAPDTMVKSRVRLLRQRDGLLARETWSNPATGAFAFDGLDESQQFIALAEDSSGVYAPVAADRRVPGVPT